MSTACYQYPGVCQSNHIAHKWDKQYQQKQGDISNIQNITGKFIETHLYNYSSYDKHDLLHHYKQLVSTNCLPDYQHKQRLSMACMRIHSGYVKHALVHHYKELVSIWSSWLSIQGEILNGQHVHSLHTSRLPISFVILSEWQHSR